MTKHKNKTSAALLAALGGGIGLYRFYLAGPKDQWGWLHVTSLPISLLIYFFFKTVNPFFAAIPFIISVLTGFLVCLIIGTMSDEKWDAMWNAGSGQKSKSGWTMALLMVFAMAIGTGSLIAVIARTFDLLFTGGMYG